MSKTLAKLLDQPEVLVEGLIKKLENFSTFNSTDIRLLADSNNKVRSKTVDLGLDPDDTTGPELYHSLLVRFAHDEQKFSKSLGLDHAAYLTQKLLAEQNVSALKKSVAKDLLRKSPPRKLMKQLGYRSTESMLKRESISKLYILLPNAESERYLNTWWRDISSLKASDFETRPIEITSIKVASSSDEGVKSQPLMGVIALSSTVPQTTSALGLALQILEQANLLKIDSALIKLRQLESNFGKSLVDFLKNGAKEPLKLHHLPLSWKTFFHHFGKNLDDYSELFGPHITADDLKLHDSVDMLAKVSPSLGWWTDLVHVGKLFEDKAVSLNIMDVFHNHHQGLGYEARSTTHLESSLWHELMDRYLEYQPVKSLALSKLDAVTVPEEAVSNAPAENEFEGEIANLMEFENV